MKVPLNESRALEFQSWLESEQDEGTVPVPFANRLQRRNLNHESPVDQQFQDGAIG